MGLGSSFGMQAEDLSGNDAYDVIESDVSIGPDGSHFSGTQRQEPEYSAASAGVSAGAGADVYNNDDDSEAEVDIERARALEHEMYPWKVHFSNACRIEVDYAGVQKAIDAWNQSEPPHVEPEKNDTADMTQEKAIKQALDHQSVFFTALMAYLNHFWTFVQDLSIPLVMQRSEIADELDFSLRQVYFVDQKLVVFHQKHTNHMVTIKRYQEQSGTTSMKTVSLSRVWETSPLRSNKAGIEFTPAPDGSIPPTTDNFNLWYGFRITAEIARVCVEGNPLEYTEHTRLIMHHIKHILCRDDEQNFEYVLNWLAHVIQRPHVKTAVAIAIQGREGAGKGILWIFIRAIIGPAYYSHITSMAQLTGRFNASFLKQCLFAFVDEVAVDKSTSGRAQQHADKMKTLISEDTHRIEQKHMPAITMRSYVNFVESSNHAHMLYIEDNTRRFLQLEAADTYAGIETPRTAAYFTPLLACKPAYFAHLLYTRDISAFRPRAVPVTTGLMRQKLLSYAPKSVENWWLGCLREGEFPGGSSMKEQTCYHRQAINGAVAEWERIRLKAFVFNAYRCGGGAVGEGEFWTHLQRVAPITIRRSEMNQGIQIRKVGTMQAESHEKCIEYFAKELGMKPTSTAFTAWLHGERY